MVEIIKKDDHYTDTYKVRTHTKDNYDFIFISMPAGNIKSVIETLNSNNIKGTIILCCGIWEDKKVSCKNNARVENIFLVIL